MNLMIRGVLGAFLLLLTLQGQAQAQGDPTIVEALGFAGAVTDDLGATFGGGMQFGTGRLLFAAEVGYLTVDGDNNSALSVDLNLHYLFPLANNTKVTPYLLGGLGILNFSTSGHGSNHSDADAGLNLGGGLRFAAGRNWGIRPEVKFLVNDNTNTRLSVGVYYGFGR